MATGDRPGGARSASVGETVNPYAELDVPKDADKASVKRAYRRRANETHPDKPGGDPAKFALVKSAYDILMDDDRRERYDRTGDAGEKTIDNALSEAFMNINAALDSVLGDLEQQRRKVHEVANLVALITAKLGKREQDLRSTIEKIKVGITMNEKLVGRFSDTDPAGRMEGLIRNRIIQLRGFIEANERLLASVAVALAIMKDHTFKADPEHRRPQEVVYYAMVTG